VDLVVSHSITVLLRHSVYAIYFGPIERYISETVEEQDRN